jgi:hypothetical protein
MLLEERGIGSIRRKLTEGGYVDSPLDPVDRSYPGIMRGE